MNFFVKVQVKRTCLQPFTDTGLLWVPIVM